jgi:hypothetical protein
LTLIKRPKLYEHCTAIYNELLKGSDHNKIWSGKLAVTVSKYGNYTTMVSALRDMGCIELLARGSPTSDTIVQLIKPPDEESINSIVRKGSSNTSQIKGANDQRFRILEDRIAALEKKYELLVNAIEPLIRGD